MRLVMIPVVVVVVIVALTNSLTSAAWSVLDGSVVVNGVRGAKCCWAVGRNVPEKGSSQIACNQLTRMQLQAVCTANYVLGVIQICIAPAFAAERVLKPVDPLK